ncbi:hypothetical protein HY967_04600, partial [Candidatus Jorgensenbacteria bacterium]|nr:hypothetical protein [Candidatus Jorgensenbacteria bacterium]
MSLETRVCQNCKQNFVIEPEDFLFYEKMQVPPPTFCPTCRFQRRTMFRNERVLYKRACDLCGKDTIAVFAPDNKRTVFCSSCWWSDKWDPLSYGVAYDDSRSFFEQLDDLAKRVPYPSLIIDQPTLVNSDYVNHAGHLKNCYLVFDTDYAENVLYATIANGTKDSMDLKLVDESELCYWDINCLKCSRVFFSEDCSDCHNVYFSKNLSGCSNCIGCVNLRNKNYHIFNQLVSKEDYEKEIQKLNLGSFKSLLAFDRRVRDFWKKSPHKFIHGRHNSNITGDYIYNSKNLKDGYICRGVEDGRFCQRLSVPSAKDVYDYTEWGYNAQRIYECVTVGEYVDRVKFSSFCFKNSRDVEYSMGIVSSSNLFGCVGLRGQEFCILNRRYKPDEYKRFRDAIMRDMTERPYVDARGRVFGYGEFFPYDLSPFDYNESTAVQYFPLKQEAVVTNGWRWREPTLNTYEVTMSSENIPDSIHDVAENILNEVFGCSRCSRAFRVIKSELELLRRFSFPLPRMCSECRHAERMKRLNPPSLWKRQCAKCASGILTSYAPNREEIVYCQRC